jgi:peptide/nickel transport system permease protein
VSARSGTLMAGTRPLRWPRLMRTAQGRAGLLLLGSVAAVALIGPLVAPHPLDAPIGIPGAGPSEGAPLGTDDLGRDVLSRVLHGGASVLGLATLTTLLTYAAGISIGMIAGMTRSLLDPILMRSVDVLLTFPPLLLLMVLIAGAGSSFWVIVAGIVIVLFPGVARVVRTATIEVSTTSYIEAAVARAEPPAAIMRREILPNIMPSILADVGVRFSWAIILAASINFLGLGSQPPAANWGLMVAENRDIISSNIWSVFVPAALLAALTISVNLLGDAYARSLDRSEIGDDAVAVTGP